MTIGQTFCPYCSNHCALVKDAIFFSCAKCNNSLLAISRPDPIAPPDVYPADLLDFQVNELIGQGGMGRVFKGIDKKTGSIVAIKFPSKELIYSEIEKERFSNEINTLKLLNSPYIVRFFTSGVVAGFPFFVMEYVSGKNLGVAIQMAKQRGSAFPFDVVLGWFNQFCQALQSLHLHGIIHRDLKPQNIIITENGGLKIVDLGISKNLSNDSKNTITSLGGAGTFDYMAPEQLLGINNDSKSDIYSGGILFYEVLTSYLPLGNVKKPSVINETVPSWFDDIVFGMMERDPNARPSILEIFKKLQDFIPVSSTSPLPLPPRPSIDILFYIKIWVPILLFFICSYIFAKSEFWEVSNHAFEYDKRYGDNNFLISGYLTFIPLIFWGCCFGITYFWIYLPLYECFLSQVLENAKGTENDNQNKPRKHPSGLIVMGFGLLFLGLQYFWHIDLAENHYRLLGEDAGKRGKFDSALYWFQAAVVRNPNYPIGHLGLASAHYQKGEFAEARREASRAIELNPKIVEAFCIRGNVYIKQQEYSEAITDYTKAIELDPKYVNAYNNRGNTYHELKKYDEAITDYTKAIELDPKYVDAYYNRGNTYHDLKKYDEAITDYTKAIELDPKYVLAYNNRGNTYHDLKKYDEAITDYTKAIELDPKYVYANYRRGYAYHQLKKYDEAITDYTKAIELDPKYLDAYYNRGIAYHQLKKYDEAIADYTKAIELDPKYVNAYYARYYNRGIAYHQLKKYDEAIADYTKAIELDPKYVNAYYARGNTYHDLKKHEEAIADYTKAIELDPKLAAAYNNRGKTYHQLKKHEESIADCNKAIELDPKYVDAYYNRGNTYADLKKYDDAIADYTKAIDLDPKNVDAYYNRGNTYHELKKYDDAIADYTKAIELDPKNADAYNNRGAAYNNLKKYFEAMADCNKAIELDPKLAAAYNNRGSTYHELKKYDDAIADYTKAIELDPKDAYAYNNRGDAYNNLKKYSEAMADCNKAIELEPKNANIYDTRGGVYRNLKKYPEAIEDYTKSIELDPNYGVAYNNRGLVYFDQKKYSDAEEDFTTALKILPKTDDAAAESYFGRILSYFHLGKLSEAAADFEKTKDLVPKHADAFYYRGLVNHQFKKYLDAITDFNSAIEFNPKNANSNYYAARGLTYKTLGKTKEAEADFVSANLVGAAAVIAQEIKPGKVDVVDFGEGVKLEMVLIPAGKFKMGSTKEEIKRFISPKSFFSDVINIFLFLVIKEQMFNEEKKIMEIFNSERKHEVALTKSFYIGKYEVTQEQWEAVIGNNPSSTKGSKLPVTNVSWNDCQEFIKKLNSKTNGGYRLPSEAEWEYSCRAGTSATYSFGDSVLPKDANYIDSNIGNPVAVGSYKPNAFGLYDMHGNVYEWCEDWYGDYPFAVKDPKGPAKGEYRVMRGGSFGFFETDARSSRRESNTETNLRKDVGFRLARTP